MNILNYYYGKNDERGILLDYPTPKISVIAKEVMQYNTDCLQQCLDYNKSYSQKMGFTVTFNPKKKLNVYGKMILISKMTNDELYYTFKNVMEKRIKKKIKYYNFYIMPEISNGGMFHFHGIVYDMYPEPFITDIVKYMRYKFGYVKPEVDLSVADNWVKYMFKGVEKSQRKCLVYHHAKEN